jgi:hypothetical protein
MNDMVAVRSLNHADFGFIGKLASKIRRYTAPSPYVLWMLARFHGEWSAVAEDTRARLGYLLAFPVSDSSIFVWQLACTAKGQRLGAPDALASYLRDLMIRGRYQQLRFTTVPRTATERALRGVAYRVLKSPVKKQAKLPNEASRLEWEYVIDLNHAVDVAAARDLRAPFVGPRSN